MHQRMHVLVPCGRLCDEVDSLHAARNERRRWRVILGDRLADDPALYFDAHVFVCTNRRAEGHPKGSCAARGSEELRDYIKLRAKLLGIPKVRINSAGCLDRCENGPVIVVYPEGIWYRVRNKTDADEILQEHLQGRSRASALMLPP